MISTISTLLEFSNPDEYVMPIMKLDSGRTKIASPRPDDDKQSRRVDPDTPDEFQVVTSCPTRCFWNKAHHYYAWGQTEDNR